MERAPTPVEVEQERYRRFIQLLHKCCAENNQENKSLEVDVIRSFFARVEKKKPFNNAEIDACVDKMANENKVMRNEDTVFFI